MQTLKPEQKHIMNLIDRGIGPDGWTPVSEQLYSVLSANMPEELADFEKFETGGRAMLTEEGKSVLRAMKWL